jgi:serine/threonine-protein kinase
LEPLIPQSSIAHYHLTVKLGQGGMGEVWRATDTKLRREVAIKLLPENLAHDRERMMRFEREAQVLASLNHPNIAQIYGVEERALIMELVEGKTLHGPLPVDTALLFAQQIAAALEAAHAKGIVHRDLKPANVMVTPTGAVKVLDFGLARVTEAKAGSDASIHPTVTMSTTHAGIILGTAAYMSPEQARGQAADRRADIWAFGVVFYEMLTGKSTFSRQSLADTLAAIMTAEPDLSAVPENLRGVIARCLQKDPRKRWQDIGDVHFVLQDHLGVMDPPANSARPRYSAWAPWIVAAGTCVTALGTWAGLLRSAHEPAAQRLIHLNVDLGSEARLDNDRGKQPLAISPDGTRIAFSCATDEGELRICTRRFDEARTVELGGTDGAEKIFFSPDGAWIGFGARGKLKKVSVQGGAPIVLANAPFDRGASWGEDGFIVAALTERTGLVRLPDTGGNPQAVTDLRPGENAHRWPQVLPGAKALLFTANSQPGDYENASIDVVSIKTGERRTLQRGGYYGRYLPGGLLVYMHQGTLFGARMDLDRLVLTGPAMPVLTDVDSRPGDGGAAFDCSRSGEFVYLSGKTRTQSTVQWLERSGRMEPLIKMPGSYKQIRLSPEGRWLALVKDSAANPDLWVYDIVREAMIRLTFGGANEEPVWSPNGKHLAYHSGRGFGVWWIRADGSGEPHQLVASKVMQSVTSLTNAYLAFEETGNSADTDLWTVPIEGSDTDNPKIGAAALFLRTPAIEGDAVFSPDERWVAYTSDESGSDQVYVRAFQPGAISQSGSKTQVSTGGGACPMWSRGAGEGRRELFYISNDRRIMVVGYTTTSDSFVPDKPVRWTDFQVEPPDSTPGFTRRSSVDIAPDGKRFAVLVPANTEVSKPSTHVRILFHFADELERKTARNR